MGKIILVVFLITTTVIPAFANPFFGGDSKSKKPNKIEKELDKELKNMLPPLPMVPPLPPEQPKPEITIKGKINENVIIEIKNKEHIIKDGSVIENCLIEYPNVYCGSDKDTKISEFNKEKNRLLKENKELQQKISKLKTVLSEVGQKAEFLAKELESKNSEIQTLKDNLFITENNKEKINTLLSEEKEKTNNLVRTIETKDKEISSLNTLLQAKDSEIQLLKSNLSELEKKQALLAREKEQLSTLLSEEKEKINNLTKTIGDKGKEILFFKDKIAELENNLALLLKEKEKLDVLLSEEREKTNNLTKTIETKDNEISSFKNKVSELEKTISLLDTQNQSLTKEIESKNNEIFAFKNKILELQKNHTTQRQQTITDILQEKGYVVTIKGVGEALYAEHGDNLLIRIKKDAMQAASQQLGRAILNIIYDGDYVYLSIEKNKVTVQR